MKGPITALVAGQLATMACVEEDGTIGGFARKPAPCDGLLFDGDRETVFIPRAELERVIAELDAYRARRGRR